MNAMIFLWLVVSIAIILFTILKLKLNPTISLILGSIFMGACLRSLVRRQPFPPLLPDLET